jgi:hypothetical protein
MPVQAMTQQVGRNERCDFFVFFFH